MMIDIEKVIAEAKDISARWHSQNGLTVGPGKAWVDYVDDLLTAIEQLQNMHRKTKNSARVNLVVAEQRQAANAKLQGRVEIGRAHV